MKSIIEYSIQAGTDVIGPQPNTNDGLLDAEQVTAYTQKARSFVPNDITLHIIPFVMITEQTTFKQIDDCVKAGIVNGKGYPRDRTTKSQNGIRHHGRVLPQIKHCGEVGMNYHQHPEHSSMLFYNRDAEFAFVPVMEMYLQEAPKTRIFWEHGSDARCILHWEYFAKSTGRFFVTLTAHHPATNEDEMFGDVRGVCKPPIKTEWDRREIVNLIEKDYDWVTAALDDAFHDEGDKFKRRGRCACGSFTTPFGLQLYAHVLGDKLFQTCKGRETFVNFTSRNTRRIHNLPPSSRVIELIQEPLEIPETYPVGGKTALPFWAGQELKYKIKNII